MKNKRILLIMMLLLMVLFTGCGEKPKVEYDEYTGSVPPVVQQQDALPLPTQAPTEAPAPSQGTPEGANQPDDTVLGDEFMQAAMQEEQDQMQFAQGVYDAYGNAVYAGTTPIPLDPIDMPTPTPRPELEFTYTAQTNQMGYSFEAPSDWLVQQDEFNAYVLSDPTVRDNVNAMISFTKTAMHNPSISDAKETMNSTLSTIQMAFTEWREENAAKRGIMDHSGYYNVYRGVMHDGTIIRGLVHVIAMDDSLLTIHMQAPAWFNSSYTKVYTRIRNTIQTY